MIFFDCVIKLLRPSLGHEISIEQCNRINADALLTLFLVTNTSGGVSELWKKLKEFSRNYNIFPSVPPSNDEHELRTQRITTRLFIILFISSMTILFLYTSLIRRTKTINVEEPSFVQYSHLYSTYSQTLTCPCSKISMNYDELLRINYTLHQVCNSNFVDPSWFNYLGGYADAAVPMDDFRFTVFYAFQGLKGCCEMVNRTISDSLTQFYSQPYVSASVMPEYLFKLETKALVDRFRSSMTNNFLLSLSMIRDTTQANALLSAKITNYLLLFPLERDIIQIITRYYGACFCYSSSQCSFSSVFLKPSMPVVQFYIPGFYSGCYVMEALLQSNLECFYRQQCIKTLQSYMLSPLPKNFTELDSSLSSEYLQSSTISELLNQLMIEKWNVSATYERYFNACQPAQCTYTFEMRIDIIYIVTTLFGIAGGLTTVLKFILPRVIKFIRKKKEQQQPTTGKIKSKTMRIGS